MFVVSIVGTYTKCKQEEKKVREKIETEEKSVHENLYEEKREKREVF